jgi:hypothetical protein
MRAAGEIFYDTQVANAVADIGKLVGTAPARR